MELPPNAVVFWLKSLNDEARECVNDEKNESYVEQLPKVNKVIRVAYDANHKVKLSSLGTAGDIVLRGPQVSRVQIEFILHPRTLEILLRDKSSWANTGIFQHGSAEPFAFSENVGIPRQLVLNYGKALVLHTGVPTTTSISSA